jgi:hypothetical protein
VVFVTRAIPATLALPSTNRLPLIPVPPWTTRFLLVLSMFPVAYSPPSKLMFPRCKCPRTPHRPLRRANQLYNPQNLLPSYNIPLLPLKRCCSC